MKKIVIIALILISVVSCKNDSKSEKNEVEGVTESTEKADKQSDGLTLLKGEFVYYDGAAVLQTNNEIYGVLLTGMLEELNEKASVFKKTPTDMVQVEIRGKITNEKHDTILWENKVEVIEIINVTPNTEEENNIIKLGS